jgi:glycerophosphoryl diester phosphodiesterase
MNGTPIVIAHRGASKAEPENTVAAFRRAAIDGATWVELDVRLSRDGALVVHHDPRYRDGRPIVDVDVADRPPSVPLLDEALDACDGMGVNVEIKNVAGEPGYDPTASIAGVVATALDERARTGRATPPILVSSFDVAVLDAMREREPRIDTALLTFLLEDPAQTVTAASAAGHRALHPFDATVDARLVALAHELELLVNVWTVDDPTRIVELASLGVDGICTNVPHVAVAALANRRR